MTQHLVQLSISLKPVWHASVPEICVGVPGNIKTLFLDTPTTFNFEYTAENNSYIIVELLNKTVADTILDKNLDKAVIIEDISFFGIADPKFIWAGILTPIYPDYWIEENRNKNIELPKELTNLSYIGFNGQWRLDFTVPVFTWMHKIQDLGWVYN
jgi:hypothetical protein